MGASSGPLLGPCGGLQGPMTLGRAVGDDAADDDDNDDDDNGGGGGDDDSDHDEDWLRR